MDKDIVIRVKGGKAHAEISHGGIEEMIRSRTVPRIGRSRWPGAKYYSGLARFPGDKTAYCSTEQEWDRKRKERGMTTKVEDVLGMMDSS